jgi:gamma-glutamylputrescine oxidase
MSFWLKDDAEWCSHRTTEGFPECILDAVVIGGGISGASAGYHLAKRGMSCVVVECAGFCSGATGRNGGFISPGASEGFEESVNQYGLEEACAINDYSSLCIAEIHKFAEEHNISCELRFNGQVTLAQSQVELERLRKSFEYLISHGAEVEWWDHMQCVENTKSSDYIAGLFKQNSGNLWAAKLAFGILSAAEKLGANLQADTAVISIQSGSDYSTINTDRGVLRARYIVHATNAWASELIPELKDVIIPVRNQVKLSLSICFACTNAGLSGSDYQSFTEAVGIWT